ncbi:hypothetical protein PInf_006712 [Phytophthora infestans]|nr:hypothetical protein PInf_006712 [Phytophthora infestans]
MQCSVALTLLILLFVFEATSQLPHSASPFAVLSQTHANSNTEQVVDVIVIGATGDLATKYLWVAMFRMALEGKMVSRRTFRLFAGASDTLERGRIWHENFFNEKFAERVCGVFEDKMSAEQVYCREFLEWNSNLIQLCKRFAATLNPIWNSNSIQDIHIEMTETATLQHRVSYFDSSGIIRDVMVNHLQLLLNVAVAPSFDAAISIHEAQLRFIRSLRVSSRQSLFIAQYDEYAAHYEAR